MRVRLAVILAVILTSGLLAVLLSGGKPPPAGCPALTAAPPDSAGLAADTLALMDTLIAHAIRAQAMPGCRVLVARNGRIAWDKAYGYLTYDSLVPVTRHTYYDLASLTKVLATTPAVMHLYEQGRIRLGDPLSNYLLYLFNTDKAAITIRQTLAHQADLYPYLPFWQYALEAGMLTTDSSHLIWQQPALRDSVLHWAATSPLFSAVVDSVNHAQYMYSDLGFLFLQDLIERQTGQPLDSLVERLFYRPLGIGLRYNAWRTIAPDSIAPTFDRELRNQKLQGVVHDQNTALLGGVGGQAGLFGRARDVAVMLQMMLQKGCYDNKRYFSEKTVNTFLQRPYRHNRRALGWDRPGPEPNGPVSRLASDSTFGHSAFTGCSIWADPQEKLIFVFLANRIYPDDRHNKLADMNIRTRIQDLVYRALINRKTPIEK